MKVRLLVALTLLICSSAWAAPPQKHQYIVKLKYLFQQPNASAAAPLTDVVTRGGGQVDYEGWDRLVVTLPDNAVEAVAKHQSTKYMQLVRSGPPAAVASAQTISANSVNAGAPTTVPRALSAPLRPVPTSSSTWDSGTYVYDGAGNITSIGTDSFTYDQLSRLATASIKGNTETYTYDQFGNLIYKTTTPAQGPALPVDLTTSTATNQLSAQPYDTAGNLKGTAGTELNVYDPFNMLREKDVSGYGGEFYLYNANDERIAVISNPCGVTPPNCASALITVSARDEDGHVLRQFDLPYQQYATGSAPWLWLEDYVYRDGLLLAAERETAEGGRRHFHLDHLGSPRLVTGTGGARIAAHDYYPFGVEITPLRQETVAGFDREEPMKFTGHERDFNIGVLIENTNYNDSMHARSTVAQWGRFLSVDPAIKAGAMHSPQLWNRYSYTTNNPMNRVDPDGRNWFNVNGGWQYHDGADWEDKKGHKYHSDYTHLIRVRAVGTTSLGSTVFQTTLFNQNKVVYAQMTTSGGGSHHRIPMGNYFINADKQYAGPVYVNPNSPLGNPHSFSGIQMIPNEGFGVAVRDAYGPIRAYLNPFEGENAPEDKQGNYFHGQSIRRGGITHGCLCYGQDETILKYLWQQTGQIPVAVDVPVVQP